MAKREDRMKITLETWLANPLLSYDQIAKLAGVGSATFYRYRQDAAFMEQYHSELKRRFEGLEGAAIAKLGEAVSAGNWNAIKYVLDGSGYAAAQKVEQTSTVFTITIEGDENENSTVEQNN